MGWSIHLRSIAPKVASLCVIMLLLTRYVMYQIARCESCSMHSNSGVQEDFVNIFSKFLRCVDYLNTLWSRWKVSLTLSKIYSVNLRLSDIIAFMCSNHKIQSRYR